MKTDTRKYHINPETGRPNICRATVRSCKYAKDGQMPPHFDTKEEAKDFHAKQMAEEHDTFTTLKKNDTVNDIDFEEDPYIDDNDEYYEPVDDDKLAELRKKLLGSDEEVDELPDIDDNDEYYEPVDDDKLADLRRKLLGPDNDDTEDKNTSRFSNDDALAELRKKLLDGHDTSGSYIHNDTVIDNEDDEYDYDDNYNYDDDDDEYYEGLNDKDYEPLDDSALAGLRKILSDSNTDDLLAGSENRDVIDPFDNFGEPKYPENVKKTPVFMNSVKIDNRSAKTVDKTINHYKRLGYNVGRMSLMNDAEISFYHAPSKGLKTPQPGMIRSYDRTQEHTTITNKPTGVLWLSSGQTDGGGNIMTSWGNFWANEDKYLYGSEDDEKVNNDYKSDGTVDKAVFHKNAVVLELNESNVAPFISDNLDPSYANLPARRFMRSFQHLDWGKIQDSGVDVVRINGDCNRDYFYGYDCDSLVVLNGDSIVGWESNPKASKYDEYEYIDDDLSFKEQSFKE